MTLDHHGVMQVLAFLSQKGGAGKTTLAVHTAVAAHEAGEAAVLIDTDPQKSASVWGDARQGAAPIVATANVSELERVLKAALEDGMGLAIIDAAPPRRPRGGMDCEGGQPGCHTLPSHCVRLGRGRGCRSDRESSQGAGCVRAVCLPLPCARDRGNAGSTRGYGLPVAPVEITDRRAFARAVASGRAVTEFEGDGKAAAEIRALWAWLKEQMA